MADGAIEVLERRLAEATAADSAACDGGAWWHAALERVGAEGAAALPVLFPALARRLGRGLIGGGRATEPSVEGASATIDLNVWRVCDAAGLALLRRAADLTPDALVDLFLHGDFEERSIVLRAQTLLPATAATARLFAEAQRTNTATHFEALACDNDLPVRACGIDGFDRDDVNRLVLKAAFLDLPLARLFRAEELANAELSRMLQGLATEREAAGRPVWADTDRMLGLAPARGTLLRLLGTLEHGSDARRRAAAEALARQTVPDLLPLVRDRAQREPVPELRALLDDLVRKWSHD